MISAISRIALLLTALLAAVAAYGQDGGALFAPIAEVLTHPRCLNCHTATNYPKQGDERRRHDQLVVRGADGHGAPSLHCSACHQNENVVDGKVPGAPHWHLAPLSMAWEDEQGNALDNASLCAVLKDRRKNGNRSLADLLEHMEKDALVLWGWEPGGRSLPPLTHDVFMEKLKAWVEAGGPC